MHSLLSFWNSLELVAIVGTILKFAGAIIGIFILILGLQEAKLRKKFTASEKTKLAEEIADAKAAANQAVSNQEVRRLPKSIWPSFAEFSRAMPKGEFTMEYPSNDQEAVNFANDIRDMLVFAGFTITNDLQLLNAPQDEGWAMLLHSKENQPKHAVTIFNMLRKIDPSFSGQVQPRVPEGKVIIRIGHKPKVTK